MTLVQTLEDYRILFITSLVRFRDWPIEQAYAFQSPKIGECYEKKLTIDGAYYEIFGEKPEKIIDGLEYEEPTEEQKVFLNFNRSIRSMVEEFEKRQDVWCLGWFGTDRGFSEEGFVFVRDTHL